MNNNDGMRQTPQGCQAVHGSSPTSGQSSTATFQWLGRSVGGLLTWCLLPGVVLLAADMADVKIWEFSPYVVKLECAFSADVSVSEMARKQFQTQLANELERTFRAAWQVEVSSMPPEVAGAIGRRFEGFTLEDLQDAELVLVVSTAREETKSLRTFDVALEAVESVYLARETLEMLELAASRYVAAEDTEAASKLLGKSVVFEGGSDALLAQLQADAINCALIPRAQLPAVTIKCSI